MVFSLIPVMQNYENRAWVDVIGPYDFYAYLWQHNSLLPLLLPLVAAVPFTLAFTGQLTNRYLTYTRTRQDLRALIGVRFAWNGAITFLTFFVVALMPQLFVVFGQKSYDTAGYGLNTPAEIEAARLHSLTFGQLLAYGSWAPIVAYAAYVGLTAALYAALSMCSVLAFPNRVLGLTLPWIAFVLASFGMAVLWLEAYSVALVFPFGLQQLPLWHLAVPMAGLFVVTVAAVLVVVLRAPKLAQLQ